MAAVEITFINTPQTVHESRGEVIGKYDSHLCDVGKLQTKQLSEKLTGLDVDIIFTSPLTHSKEAANLLFIRDFDIVEDPHISECDFGDFNLSTLNYWKKEKYITTGYPNGESYLDVGYRVQKFLEYLKSNHDSKKILVVSHESVRCALEVFLKERSFREVLEESQSKELDKRRDIIYRYTLK